MWRHGDDGQGLVVSGGLGGRGTSKRTRRPLAERVAVPARRPDIEYSTR